MKALIVLSVLAVVVFYLWFVLSVIRANRQRRRRKAVSNASWKTAHHSIEGETRVLVQLTGGDPDEEIILETQVVDTFSDAEPNYNDRFISAMDTARERASTLNSER